MRIRLVALLASLLVIVVLSMTGYWYLYALPRAEELRRRDLAHANLVEIGKAFQLYSSRQKSEAMPRPIEFWSGSTDKNVEANEAMQSYYHLVQDGSVAADQYGCPSTATSQPASQPAVQYEKISWGEF